MISPCLIHPHFKAFTRILGDLVPHHTKNLGLGAEVQRGLKPSHPGWKASDPVVLPFLERDVCPELVEKIQVLLLGNKGYMRQELQKELSAKGLHLQTHLRDNMKDSRPKGFLKWMKGTRRLIETVIGQLTERFHIEKVRARNL